MRVRQGFFAKLLAYLKIFETFTVSSVFSTLKNQPICQIFSKNEEKPAMLNVQLALNPFFHDTSKTRVSGVPDLRH